MVKHVKRSRKDEEKISSLSIDPHSISDDFFDYHGVVVHKPWGYEYLVFRNKSVAVWGLFIKQGFETSFHCHPNKKTTLTVLSGKALVRTHLEEAFVSAGTAMLFEKGVFHCTKALSPEGIIILETETPTNKRDLVRLEDAYGRKAKGYEGAESRIFLGDGLGFHLPNFCGDQLAYNVSRKIGDFDLRLSAYMTTEEFKKALRSLGSEGLVGILEGVISGVSDVRRLERGDIVTIEELKKMGDLAIMEGIELLFIIRNI